MRVVFATVLALALAAAGANAQSLPRPRTVVAEQLGIPSAERWPNDYYPRNVWDMQVYGHYLYLGAGNSSNSGPAPNAGPVPILRYDGRAFESAFTVREEQIAVFRVFQQSLFVPGHDAKQGWEFGNLYVFNNRSWRVFRSIPNGIHVYDIYPHGDRLLAVGGTRNQEFDAWIANSEGGPWRSARFRSNPALSQALSPGGDWARHGDGRLVSLFELGGTLYASGAVRLSNPALASVLAPNEYVVATLFRFDGNDGFAPISATTSRFGESGFVETGHAGPDLFPGADRPSAEGLAQTQVRRAVKLGDRTFYIGALWHNDHQWIPVGLFSASDPNNARRLGLPQGVQAYDLLVRRGRLYALGNLRIAEDRYEVQLLRLRGDGTALDAIARFEAPAFARSFEFFRGDWYFGLGSEVSVEDARLPRAEAARVDWGQRLSAATGAILRVRGDAVE